MWNKVWFQRMNALCKLIYLYYDEKSGKKDTCLFEFEKACEELGINKLSVEMKVLMDVEKHHSWPLAGNNLGNKCLEHMFENKIMSTNGKSVTLLRKFAKVETPVIETMTDLQITMFNEFYDKYPKKQDKHGNPLEMEAREAFKSVENESQFATLMEELEQKINSPKWEQQNGKFIPYPAKFISNAIVVGV